ncbi:hypothetical protein [Neobacillus sp. LXY-1]|uniref:hypothetical protein n=1 Tax=Neobacillus sp. LXY-1 TaxID=3379133 RepID=UPI003EDE967F
MPYKKRVSLALLCVLVISGMLAIIWLYMIDPKPDSFPTNKQLINQMNEIFSQADAKGVQDIVPIDKRHKVVPYFSEEGDYGISYWEWRLHKWQIVYIDTTGEPSLWKIDKSDPSTYYFVWNLQSSNQLRSLKFFLIRDRQFYSVDGEETYHPKIKLETKVKLKKLYGIMPIPEKWSPVVKSMKQIGTSEYPISIFNEDAPMNNMFYGWVPFDQKGQEAIDLLKINGDSYYGDGVNIEELMILGKEEIDVLGN